MKCLVIVESTITHLLLATPVIRCLKQQLRDSVIHLVIQENLKPVLVQHHYIDVMFGFQRSLSEIKPQLKEEGYDSIIDLQNNSESGRLCSDLKVPSIAVSRHSFQKFLFTNLKWNMMPEDHVVDEYFKLVSKLGVRNDGRGLDFFISPHGETKQSDIPASHHAGYIALVIGRTFPTNTLPLEKLREFCGQLQHPIILIGEKEDVAEGNAIAQIDAVKIYNACGKFNLQENADLLRKSKLVITHDCYYMHIAAALKKPIVSIWGSTTPSLGKHVYYGEHFNLIKNENVQVHKLWCRPCTTNGRELCPLGHFKCMRKIDIHEMVLKVSQRLGKN